MFISGVKLFFRGRFACAAVMAPLLFVSCSTAEGKFYKLLERYSAGETALIDELHSSLLEAFSFDSYDSDSIFFTKNLILKRSGEEPEIIYPEEVTLNADESIDENMSFGNMNNGYVLLGNNKGFCVFNSDGDPVAIFRAEQKSTLDAMALREESVVYLSKGRLYEYSVVSKGTRLFDSAEFNAPYKKFFRSFIYTTSEYGALITGIAGYYYISVYDVKKGSVRLKNVSSSAFDCAISGSNLYYLRGGTGAWSVARYEIQSKTRTDLKRLSKLENILITPHGFIYYSEGRGGIENYSGRKAVIPGEWRIKGNCNNLLLIEHDSRLYLVDFSILLDKLMEVNGTSR